jgi:hypothetical protein
MLQRLHETLAAVAPVVGVSGVQGAIRIDYDPAPTPGEQAAAEAALAAFDWGQGAHDLWLTRKTSREVGRASLVRLLANRQNNALAYADVTGLSFELDANAHYLFRFDGAYTSTANTVGCWIAVNGPANPADFGAGIIVYTAANAPSSRAVAGYDVGAEPTASQAATPMIFQIFGNISTNAAGLLIVRFRPEVAGTVTIRQGAQGQLFGVG